MIRMSIKTIEGRSYILQTYPDKETGKVYRQCVEPSLRQHRKPDGYLYTSRTMNPKHPHEWAGNETVEKVEDLSHEFYNLDTDRRGYRPLTRLPQT